MNARLLILLLLGLTTVTSRAEDSETANSVDSESVWITSIAPLGDGSFVAGKATGLLYRPSEVVRLQADAPNNFETLYEHPAAVWTVDASSDSKSVASADYKGNLMIYDVASKKTVTHETAFERWCQMIKFSPDNQSIVAGNESGKLFVWDVAAAKVSNSKELGKASLNCLAFSPSGKQLAASDGEGKLHLLNWPSLEPAGTITVGEDSAWCIAYADDSTLIVGSADRQLYRVAAKADAKPEAIAKGSDWITRIAVSPGGQIAASEVSGKIHFASGGSLTTIGAESGVWALCFGGPGQILIGTRKDGIVTAAQSWTFKPLELAKKEAPAGDEQAKSEPKDEPDAEAKKMKAEAEKKAAAEKEKAEAEKKKKAEAEKKAAAEKKKAEAEKKAAAEKKKADAEKKAAAEKEKAEAAKKPEAKTDKKAESDKEASEKKDADQ